MSLQKQSIAIIGGGAAGIMCACHLNSEKYNITLFEKTSRLGRKLLVAGEGGFNLTHGESLEAFTDNYQPKGFIDSALSSFSNKDLVAWLHGLGIDTFVGTSRRIFPVKGIKPYQVVDKMLLKVKQNNVLVVTSAELKGWNKDELIIDVGGQEKCLKYDKVLLALGGASWAKTGSDGSWSQILEAKGIKCNTFQSSNCGWKIDWPEDIIQYIKGKPLKNIAITVDGHVTKGEALITTDGIEGGAIYAQAGNIRRSITNKRKAIINIDFKTNTSKANIIKKLQGRSKSIKHTLLREIKISDAALHIIKSQLTKEAYHDSELLASTIKVCPLITTQSESLDKAISTAGGIDLEEVDTNFEFKKLPDVFAIGEMLNWDTRTGGYLLQACFSMGVHLANHLNKLPNK